MTSRSFWSSAAILLLPVLLACSRSSKPAAAGPFCYPLEPGGPGVNPLLGKMVLCYDDRATCDKRQANDQEAAGACAAPAQVAWHCFTFPVEVPGVDPLEGVASCLPSAALCEAARAPTATACTPAASVACSTNQRGVLNCVGDLASCERANELVNRVLPQAQPRGPCTLRR